LEGAALLPLRGYLLTAILIRCALA
jgi:hypothetical protein